MPADNDWRLRGQQEFLQGAILKRQRYRARSPKWEHDHCAFCWAKFMDPSFSSAHAAAVAIDPAILTEGYAVKRGKTIDGVLDDYWWICPACERDFVERFEWTVVEDPPAS